MSSKEGPSGDSELPHSAEIIQLHRHFEQVTHWPYDVEEFSVAFENLWHRQVTSGRNIAHATREDAQAFIAGMSKEAITEFQDRISDWHGVSQEFTQVLEEKTASDEATNDSLLVSGERNMGRSSLKSETVRYLDAKDVYSENPNKYEERDNRLKMEIPLTVLMSVRDAVRAVYKDAIETIDAVGEEEEQYRDGEDPRTWEDSRLVSFLQRLLLDKQPVKNILTRNQNKRTYFPVPLGAEVQAAMQYVRAYDELTARIQERQVGGNE